MREVLRWPWWFTLLIMGLDLSVVIAIWAGLGNSAALAGGISTLVLSFIFYRFTSLTIEIEGDILRVGGAVIEKKYLGEKEILDRSKMQHYMSIGFNPSAFYSIRFWVKTGVKISIDDARDPTPFWIVSSKRATEIAALLKN